MNGEDNTLEARAAVEAQVASIWAEVLQRESVDHHAHFSELGGNSLAGLRLVARLNTEMQADLPVEAFLDYPSVADMADYLIAGSRSGQGPGS